MPNVNMAETVHASWKLAGGKNESDLFDTTIDDLFWALQQSTSYYEFLTRNTIGSGPDRDELNIRAAMRLGNPVKNCKGHRR